MTEKERFTHVGIRPTPPAPIKKQPLQLPLVSLSVLAVLLLGCLLAGVIAPGDPNHLDIAHCSAPPSRDFLFGTDALGRDLFACIWHGGRVSLFIGFFATLISTLIAVVYGSLSGIASSQVDTALMRLTEIFLSVPGLLLTIFLQAILGEATPVSLSVVIGLTGWFSIAKVVRTEVLQIRRSEYVLAAQCMGGGFFHVLRQHLAPNFFSAILFMVVMNVRSAIVAESTLSFMGMGLPLDVISWGSLFSLSERALMTRAWWMILIPGGFLVVLLVCLTSLGNALRRSANRKERYL